MGSTFTEAPVMAMWYCAVRASSSLGEVLRRFPIPQEDRRSALNRVQLARVAYRLGISLAGIDETQFTTQSSAANTCVAQLLLQFHLFGIPCVTAMNYSLIHRLLKRPPEERQRLLSRPMVLLPELPTDPHFWNVLREYRAVAPDLFCFDPQADAPLIHQWTAGLWRLVIDLLLPAAAKALRKGQAKVGVNELLEAYRSTEFTVNRQDVEAMHRQDVTQRKERDDLWCPFELDKQVAADRKALAEARRAKAVHSAMLASTLTPDQRAAYQTACPPEVSTAPSETRCRRPRSAQATPEQLLANLSLVEDDLPPRNGTRERWPPRGLGHFPSRALSLAIPPVSRAEGPI